MYNVLDHRNEETYHILVLDWDFATEEAVSAHLYEGQRSVQYKKAMHEAGVAPRSYDMCASAVRLRYENSDTIRVAHKLLKPKHSLMRSQHVHIYSAKH